MREFDASKSIGLSYKYVCFRKDSIQNMIWRGFNVRLTEELKITIV